MVPLMTARLVMELVLLFVDRLCKEAACRGGLVGGVGSVEALSCQARWMIQLFEKCLRGWIDSAFPVILSVLACFDLVS